MNYHLPKNTYNPRIGVAYQVSPETVVRAGYGRSFDIGVFGSIFGHAATQNLPVLQNQAVSASGTATAVNLAVGPPTAAATVVPGNGLLPNPGYAVSSRERPTTLRLPTLDAWNLSIQQAFTPTLAMTIAYVGNKGTHTFGDTSGNTTNPNEAAISLGGSQTFNGQALHWDQNLLRRYYGGTLPACSDPLYRSTAAANGVTLPAIGCGWTNDLQDFSDNLDTHYNALQVTLTKQLAHGVQLNGNYAWQQALSDLTGYSSWDKHIVAGRQLAAAAAGDRVWTAGASVWEEPSAAEPCESGRQYDREWDTGEPGHQLLQRSALHVGVLHVFAAGSDGCAVPSEREYAALPRAPDRGSGGECFVLPGAESEWDWELHDSIA
jgi:hypothetical protein